MYSEARCEPRSRRFLNGVSPVRVNVCSVRSRCELHDPSRRVPASSDTHTRSLPVRLRCYRPVSCVVRTNVQRRTCAGTRRATHPLLSWPRFWCWGWGCKWKFFFSAEVCGTTVGKTPLGSGTSVLPFFGLISHRPRHLPMLKVQSFAFVWWSLHTGTSRCSRSALLASPARASESCSEAEWGRIAACVYCLRYNRFEGPGPHGHRPVSH